MEHEDESDDESVKTNKNSRSHDIIEIETNNEEGENKKLEILRNLNTGSDESVDNPQEKSRVGQYAIKENPKDTVKQKHTIST